MRQLPKTLQVPIPKEEELNTPKKLAEYLSKVLKALEEHHTIIREAIATLQNHIDEG